MIASFEVYDVKKLKKIKGNQWFQWSSQWTSLPRPTKHDVFWKKGLFKYFLMKYKELPYSTLKQISMHQRQFPRKLPLNSITKWNYRNQVCKSKISDIELE